MSPHPIALITDSTCDIPQNMVEQYNISIIPQIVIWGDEIYRDRIDLLPLDFYHRILEDPILPTTSQPSPETFKQAYQDAIDQGAEEIVIITISSELSGTYQLAKMVADEMPVPVHVVDGKGPTMSLGWQVLAAARAREAGASAAEMVAAADSVRQNMVQILLMDSLEHLLRTGRIGKATQMVGSVLKLKPLVQINHQTGIIEDCGKARTRKKAIDMLVEKFFEQMDTTKPMHITVLHGNALPEAEALAERIQREYTPVELFINITGPVLGINTGPTALDLAGYYED